MSIWTVLNGGAWGLCLILGILMITDIIKVEKERHKSESRGE